MIAEKPQPEAGEPVLVTTARMAQMLSISTRTLRRMAHARSIRPIQVHKGVRWDWRKVLDALTEGVAV